MCLGIFICAETSCYVFGEYDAINSGIHVMCVSSSVPELVLTVSIFLAAVGPLKGGPADQLQLEMKQAFFSVMFS